MGYESLCADDFNMINKYSDMVYKLAFSLVKNKYDADDIHQEVFVKYICKRPKFENIQHEKAWFLRVTINLSKNLWKSTWKQKVISLWEDEIEETVQEMDSQDEIIEMVKHLPKKYRIVIHLFYYEELSIEEISNILKRKPSTVRTQLTRARKKLKEFIKEDIDV